MTRTNDNWMAWSRRTNVVCPAGTEDQSSGGVNHWRRHSGGTGAVGSWTGTAADNAAHAWNTVFLLNWLARNPTKSITTTAHTVYGGTSLPTLGPAATVYDVSTRWGCNEVAASIFAGDGSLIPVTLLGNTRTSQAALASALFPGYLDAISARLTALFPTASISFALHGDLVYVGYTEAESDQIHAVVLAWAARDSRVRFDYDGARLVGPPGTDAGFQTNPGDPEHMQNGDTGLRAIGQLRGFMNAGQAHAILSWDGTRLWSEPYATQAPAAVGDIITSELVNDTNTTKAFTLATTPGLTLITTSPVTLLAGEAAEVEAMIDAAGSHTLTVTPDGGAGVPILILGTDPITPGTHFGLAYPLHHSLTFPVAS